MNYSRSRLLLEISSSASAIILLRVLSRACLGCLKRARSTTFRSSRRSSLSAFGCRRLRMMRSRGGVDSSSSSLFLPFFTSFFLLHQSIPPIHAARRFDTHILSFTFLLENLRWLGCLLYPLLFVCFACLFSSVMLDDDTVLTYCSILFIFSTLSL